MSVCSIDRTEFVCPKKSEWTGAFDTIATAGTEIPDIDILDMGTASAGANTDAKAFTVEFESDFGDSVQDNLKLYMLNLPEFTGHTWAAEFEADAKFPLVSLSAVLGGATAHTIKGNPWDTVQTFGKRDSATEYDGTAKRVETILLQLQLAGGAKTWSQGLSLYECPIAAVEIIRGTGTELGLEEPLDALTSEEKGHLFVFSGVRLYRETAAGNWRFYGSIVDDTIEINTDQEQVEFRRDKPLATFHRAVSDATASWNFEISNPDPDLEARALQTTASNNAARDTREVIHGANPCNPGVSESAFILEWRTLGGHLVRYRMPRGVLTMAGSFSPGAGDFGSQAFTLEALTSGTSKTLVELTWSNHPTEVCFLPITYIST